MAQEKEEGKNALEIRILNKSTNNDALECNKRAYIGTWEEAPSYIRDNEFILNGYRVNFSSFSKIMRSLFMCHNEAFNIWSHLSGVFLFIFLLVSVCVFINPERSQNALVSFMAGILKYINIKNKLIDC